MTAIVAVSAVEHPGWWQWQLVAIDATGCRPVVTSTARFVSRGAAVAEGRRVLASLASAEVEVLADSPPEAPVGDDRC